MNVASILTGKGDPAVRTIGPEASIRDAIARLVENNIGSLVVIEDGEPAGIITERDILRCCADRPDRLAEIRVGDVMTRDLIVGEPADELDYVMGIMTRNRIRHLPILDERRLVGMVSIGDVVNVQLRETRYENRHLKGYIAGSY